MLALLAQSCYNAITGSVWSSSPRWLNNFTSTDDPRVFWYCYYQMREDLSYRKDISMKYTIVFTHNPQDFFEGIEPDDLIVVRESTNEELEAEIVPMVDGGYKAIVFPENF